jgi:hypothetical protein
MLKGNKWTKRMHTMRLVIHFRKMGEMQSAHPIGVQRPDYWPKIDFHCYTITKRFSTTVRLKPKIF